MKIKSIVFGVLFLLMAGMAFSNISKKLETSGMDDPGALGYCVGACLPVMLFLGLFIWSVQKPKSEAK